MARFGRSASGETSTLDSYRKFAGYLADDTGAHAVVDVGPELLTQWQSKLLDKYRPVAPSPPPTPRP